MLKDAPLAAILPAKDIERAKRFYRDKLGLRPAEMVVPPDSAVFVSDGAMLYVYERPGGTKADHTVAGWMVANLEKTMEALRERGVVFERYDMPGLKTDERGIAEQAGMKGAWFKDSEGNILSISEVPE
jgi:catechol 2,3-dioxygenase-like lactoylglutathione lyase family enzyme